MARPRRIPAEYQMPVNLGTDPAANLAMFLLVNTGSIFGKWGDAIKAADQRRLFGRYLGGGRIYVDGTYETLCRYVKVCFGTDSDCRDNLTWRDLPLMEAAA